MPDHIHRGSLSSVWSQSSHRSKATKMRSCRYRRRKRQRGDPFQEFKGKHIKEGSGGQMDSSNQVKRAGSLFRAIDVWRREGEGVLVRYRCFEVIPSGKFCVQSRDSYRTPFTQNLGSTLESQFLELLAEEAPDLRSFLYDSIEEAVLGHDEEFER